MKYRKSNVELLRIISMLLIVTTHFWGHCIDLKEIDPFLDGYIWGWLSKGVSYISVNTFVLISSYFLCMKSYKTERLVKLELEVLFYSVIIYLCLLVCGKLNFIEKDILKVLLPTLSGEYWFVTIFMGLLILHPFLNIAISAMSKQQMRMLCIVLTFLFVVIPNIFFFSRWMNFGSGYGIVWFVVLYVYGSYIRKYVDIEYLKINRLKLYLCAIIALFSPFLSRLLIVIVTEYFYGQAIGGGLFYGNNTILCVAATIMVFLSFLTFDIKSNKLISWLSSGSFAVYLISDNFFLSVILWNYIRPSIDLGSIYMPVAVTGVILAVYLICNILDVIRQSIFGMFEEKISELCTKIDLKISRVLK